MIVPEIYERRGSVDLVIKNAIIVDGTGNVPYQGEIGIMGGKIVSIRENLNGRNIMDSGGLMVAPGFIDLHHTDYSG